MSKIVIMEYLVGEVTIADFDDNIYEDGEHFMNETNEYLGYIRFDISNCHYMVTNELNIKVI